MEPSDPHPLCRHCRYNLVTQLDQQAPEWEPHHGPVELMCPECGKASTWPWVSPPPTPNKIPLIPLLLSVLILAAFGVLLFSLIGLNWL